MTDKEVHIPRNSREGNHSVQKSASEHVKQKASGKEHGRKHIEDWKFSAKQKAVLLSCWSGCASDLTRRADISVSVPNNCELCWGMKITPIILNEQTHPARTLKTIIFRAYMGRLFVRRVLRSCWCIFPFFHRYEKQSGTTVKVWNRWKSCKHSCIPLGWYQPRSITTRRFRTDTYYPFSLPSWCLLIAGQAIICMLTHSLQKWLSATFFHPVIVRPVNQALSSHWGGGYLCIWI